MCSLFSVFNLNSVSPLLLELLTNIFYTFLITKRNDIKQGNSSDYILFLRI